MTLEILRTKTNRDNTDKITRTIKVGGGIQRRTRFLPSEIMYETAQNGRSSGVLFKNPELISTAFYENANDLLGFEAANVSLIVLKPGQELRVWSEFSNREMWFVQEYAESEAGVPIREIPEVV